MRYQFRLSPFALFVLLRMTHELRYGPVVASLYKISIYS